jgi:uncharacterized membrane protein
MPSTKPQPEDFATRSEYRWRRKLWRRSHGGSLIVLLALWGLVSFAVLAWLIARSRP